MKLCSWKETNAFYLRITSEYDLSKLASGSFHLPHIQKSVWLGELWFQTTKLGVVIDVKILDNLLKYNVLVLFNKVP